MIIQNNSISNRAYVPYAQSISNLSKSAQRLATGFKYANASDGTGDLGVADRMRLNIKGTNALFASMENAVGYATSQDDILSHVSDIITRMSELAAAAVDTTKTSADRSALNAEFRALDSEVQGYASNSKYNGTSLFGTTATIRIGVESTDTVVFGEVDLAALTFVTMSLNAVATASAALISLRGRANSLNVLRNTARTNNARISRTINFTRSYVANLGNAESAIRNVDVAVETGEFTRQQVLQQAAQSVVAQMNNISQNALRFLQ